jgi:SAM-dependent methyltransferase
MLRNAIAPDLLELLDTGSPGDLDFYCQYARHAGGPVLVLLCGTGRVAIPIARQGVPVIGLDADAASIDLAKRKAQQAGATRAMFVRGESTDFVSDAKQSLVMIPGGRLQQLLTLEEQRACLMAARQALPLGGHLVLDLPLFDPGAQGAPDPDLRRVGDRIALIRRTQRHDAARQITEALISCQWLDQEGAVEREQYAMVDLRYSTPGEVALLLEACGFRVTFYGGFDRQPLLPGSERLVVDAERNR